MTAHPFKNRVRRHTVLILDSGVRRMVLGSLAVIMALSSTASAAPSCAEIFITNEHPYQDEALLRALDKAIRPNRDTIGLSAKDIEFLVEKVFNEHDGKALKLEDYYTKTAAERTTSVMARHIGEEIVRSGLIKFFAERDMLLESSTLYTKLIVINRHPLFNFVQASWGLVGVARGRAPIFLPEIFMKIKPDEMNILLLKGLESPEGQAITQKYHLRQEGFRAYALFNAYYTRVALAIVAAIVWNKADEFLDKEHENIIKDLFELIMKNINSVPVEQK